MCGIAGKINFQNARPVLHDTIARMCAVLRHRGPDDEGIYLDKNFGMGMRRLSIIDLATGKQPIRNEDGSIWTVLNGEIYNFAELRKLLEQKGHKFYTHTDTEVIVHAYEEYGEKFAEHLTGMFAVAVWDKRRQKLILARDRLGIKPLYYSEGPNGLLFGSETKAILQGGMERDVDLQALHDYLSFNYVPGPRSIFKHVRSLPAGHILTCSGKSVAIAPYWQLQYPSVSANGNGPLRRKLLRRTIRAAVQHRQTAPDQRRSARGFFERGGRFQRSGSADEQSFRPNDPDFFHWF